MVFIPTVSRLIAQFLIAGVAALTFVAEPAMAQSNSATPTQSAAKPATQEDINTYAWMGGVNFCVLNQSKVSVNIALPASAEMMTAVIAAKHGRAIANANNGQPLNNEMLFNGSLANVLERINNICYSKLNPKDKAEIDNIISQFRAAAAKQTPSSNTTTTPKSNSGASSPAPIRTVKPDR